jgi:glutathionyl-hydroquinone reductase
MASYIAEAGEFTRDTKYIETRITADGRDGYPVQPDRDRLVVARAGAAGSQPEADSMSVIFFCP